MYGWPGHTLWAGRRGRERSESCLGSCGPHIQSRPGTGSIWVHTQSTELVVFDFGNRIHHNWATTSGQERRSQIFCSRDTATHARSHTTLHYPHIQHFNRRENLSSRAACCPCWMPTALSTTPLRSSEHGWQASVLTNPQDAASEHLLRVRVKIRAGLVLGLGI